MNGSCSSDRSRGESSRRYFSRSSEENEAWPSSALNLDETGLQLLASFTALAEYRHDHRLREQEHRDEHGAEKYPNSDLTLSVRPASLERAAEQTHR